MLRRDPVWAEKVARRRAAFRDTWAVRDGNLATRMSTTSSTSSGSAAASAVHTLTASAALSSYKTNGSIVPEHCCFDLEPAVVVSTSTAPTTILSACVVRNGDLDLTSPTTCSSLCCGGFHGGAHDVW
jgi:hypothetical protein